MEAIAGPVAGAVVGGLLGGSDTGSSQTQERKMDPRMDAFVYGANGKKGLLDGAWGLAQQQLAQGGLNPLQQAGLDMQRQLYMSPQYQQGYNNMAQLGQNLMNLPMAGNPFTNQGSRYTGGRGFGSQQRLNSYTPSYTSEPLQFQNIQAALQQFQPFTQALDENTSSKTVDELVQEALKKYALDDQSGGGGSGPDRIGGGRFA